MLLLELDAVLLQLSVHTPAFDVLFQLPPEIGHMLSYLPLLRRLIDRLNPTTEHSA